MYATIEVSSHTAVLHSSIGLTEYSSVSVYTVQGGGDALQVGARRPAEAAGGYRRPAQQHCRLCDRGLGCLPLRYRLHRFWRSLSNRRRLLIGVLFGIINRTVAKEVNNYFLFYQKK